MKLRPEQLAGALRRELAPVYLIGGDEPLLVQEACDLVRVAARGAGAAEREVFHAEGSFDWNALFASVGSMSLFAERRLIEVRLPGGKPGKEGGKMLEAYVANPPPDTTLLVMTGKLEKESQRAKWFGAIEARGVVVQVWPVEAAQLPGWIAHRMKERGLQPDREAAGLLAERVEGNLLAAAQEVEKLFLLHGGGALSAEQVLAAVADSARFDIFSLAECAVQGKVARTARVLNGLRSEGVEPVLVLWALARELRALAEMALEVAAGTRIDQVLAKHRVWEKRKATTRAGLQRLKPGHLHRLLAACARTDRVIKGMAPGRAWDELMSLSLAVAGAEAVNAQC